MQEDKCLLHLRDSPLNNSMPQHGPFLWQDTSQRSAKVLYILWYGLQQCNTSRFPRRNRQIKLKWPSLDKSLDPPGSLGEEDVMLQATFDPLLKHWGGTREIIDIDRLYSWEYIKITVNTARCLVWRKKGSTTQLFADMCALPLTPLLDSVPKATTLH